MPCSAPNCIANEASGKSVCTLCEDSPGPKTELEKLKAKVGEDSPGPQTELEKLKAEVARVKAIAKAEEQAVAKAKAIAKAEEKEACGASPL